MLEVMAIGQYYSVQYIVNTVKNYHFVNKIWFQGSKETHTSTINYEYNQNGGNLEMQRGVKGYIDFGHWVTFNKQFPYKTLIQTIAWNKHWLTHWTIKLVTNALYPDCQSRLFLLRETTKNIWREGEAILLYTFLDSRPACLSLS